MAERARIVLLAADGLTVMKPRLQLLVVDDSAVMRQAMIAICRRDPGI